MSIRVSRASNGTHNKSHGEGRKWEILLEMTPHFDNVRSFWRLQVGMKDKSVFKKNVL